MKQTIINILIIALALPVILTSCKPNEAAYRAAYQSAIEKQQGNDPTDGTIYNSFRNRFVTREIATSKGDTASVRVESIAFITDGGIDKAHLKKYNVIAGGFKQVFNAKALRDRLNSMGYEAFVISTGEPLYYVGLSTTDSIDIAYEALGKLQAERALQLKPPYPFILQPAHLK